MSTLAYSLASIGNRRLPDRDAAVHAKPTRPAVPQVDTGKVWIKEPPLPSWKAIAGQVNKEWRGAKPAKARAPRPAFDLSPRRYRSEPVPFTKHVEDVPKRPERDRVEEDRFTQALVSKNAPNSRLFGGGGKSCPEIGKPGAELQHDEWSRALFARNPSHPRLLEAGKMCLRNGADPEVDGEQFELGAGDLCQRSDTPSGTPAHLCPEDLNTASAANEFAPGKSGFCRKRISAASGACLKQLEELDALLLRPERQAMTKATSSTAQASSMTLGSEVAIDISPSLRHRMCPTLRAESKTPRAAEETLVPRTAQKRVCVTELTETEVEDLKRYSPVEAIRQGLVLILGSRLEVYRAFDGNKSGTVSFSEFESGVLALGIPWAKITGCVSFRAVWRLFDTGGKGSLNTKDLLGVNTLDLDRDEFEMKGTSEKWSNWCNRARKKRELSRKPCWFQDGEQKVKDIQNMEHKRVFEQQRVKDMVRVIGYRNAEPATLARHLPKVLNSETVEQQKNKDLNIVHQSRNKIHEALKDAAENRKELAGLVKKITSMTSQEDEHRPKDMRASIRELRQRELQRELAERTEAVIDPIRAGVKSGLKRARTKELEEKERQSLLFS